MCLNVKLHTGQLIPYSPEGFLHYLPFFILHPLPPSQPSRPELGLQLYLQGCLQLNTKPLNRERSPMRTRGRQMARGADRDWKGGGPKWWISRKDWGRQKGERNIDEERQRDGRNTERWSEGGIEREGKRTMDDQGWQGWTYSVFEDEINLRPWLPYTIPREQLHKQLQTITQGLLTAPNIQWQLPNCRHRLQSIFH